MYGFTEKIGACYRLLQDVHSKEIFWARLACDFERSPENVARLVSLGDQKNWLDALADRIPAIAGEAEREHKKLILYGTNVTGKAIAALFLEKQVDFYGFCGRRAKEFPDGLMGKPVISPDYLFQHSGDFYVILAVGEAGDEIMNILKENHFPPAQILLNFKPAQESDHQYFEFPSLFRRGTAFVDCGCLDCRTSYLFADWCGGEYSKIFAFEPDPISYSICEQRLSDRGIRDFHLIRAGLSDHNGEAAFRAGLYGCSHIAGGGDTQEKDLTVVPIATIDDTVGEETVGFIKMDVEGAEFAALHGAERVLIRDKPLLAISVYHCVGDLLAVMDYLHQLVPEYRFWLRHYSIGAADTVLYASVDALDGKKMRQKGV